MNWAVLVVALAIYSVVSIFVLALCRAASDYDEAAIDDDLDIYCPGCDGCDIYDWGEEDWYVCHGCKLLFSRKEE